MAFSKKQIAGLSDSAKEQLGVKKRHKYNASKKEVDGITFDSTLEANVYTVFRDAGLEMDLQKRFEIQPSFKDPDSGKTVRAINYDADFVIYYGTQVYTVDSKGMVLPDFKLKQKLLLYQGTRVILVKSMKQAREFVELIRNGTPPHEVDAIFSKRKKKTKNAKSTTKKKIK